MANSLPLWNFAQAKTPLREHKDKGYIALATAVVLRAHNDLHLKGQAGEEAYLRASARRFLLSVGDPGITDLWCQWLDRHPTKLKKEYLKNHE